MTRFTLPALGMFAAIAILFAGAFADLPTWQRNTPAIVARTSDVLVATGLTTPHDRSQTVPANDLAPGNPAQPQVREPRATIATETRELETLRMSVEEVRRDLAALREQREREQAALARIETVQIPMRQAGPPTANPSPVTDSLASVATKAGGRPRRDRSGPDGHRFEHRNRHGPVAPDQRLLAARRLEAARTALAAGRRGRARWLLSITRTQMAQWSSAVGQPGTAAAEPPSKGLETAIDLLNRGDRDGAVRAIDQILAFTGGDLGNPARRAD